MAQISQIHKGGDEMTCLTCRYYPPSPERDKCPCPAARVKCGRCFDYVMSDETRIRVLERALRDAICDLDEISLKKYDRYNDKGSADYIDQATAELTAEGKI